jgi:hypothetical protein
MEVGQMTKEELEQCGCWFADTGECIKDDIDLNKFAKLIAEKERRACARICAEVGMWGLVHEIEGRGQE